MKNLKIIALLVFIAATAAAAARNVAVTDRNLGTDRWVRQTFMKSRNLPFSFKLDGVDSDTFLQRWSRNLTAKGDGAYDFEMVSPDKKLKLNCDIVIFQDFPAAEWTLHFTNLASENSPRISEVNAANLNFTGRGTDADWKLYTAHGPNDNDLDFHLSIYAPADSTVHFRPADGRSSSVTAFPFFNLTESGTSGVCIAIGWTGTWFSDFSPAAKPGDISFSAGMEGTDLFLYPGESIRTPKVALVQWTGTNRIDGNNTLRRFMLAHHSPRLGSGEPATPPLCMGMDYGDPAPCGEYESMTELLGRAVVERHRNFNMMPEVFWLDAGWYEGNNAPLSREEGRWWYSTVGSWECDSTRFPRGLRPIADDIHAAGAKFMVWFEPERVYEGSRIYREHPEWLLYNNRLAGVKWGGSRLLNLGNPDALDYICRTIGDFIEKNGIDYYRQDFNIAPAEYWAQADPEGRKGITEIRHIEGLYSFWDYLRARFPEMVIDNCASGGRRLDLETASRAIPLWRTDCNYGEPTCQQSHEYGLSQFLPLHGTGVYTTDVYCTRSGLSSAYLWAGDIFDDRNPVKGIRDALATYKELRRYYLSDFYPLSGDGSTLGKSIWLAWQFHDPADGSGILQAFRRDEATDNTYSVALHGIDTAANYELHDFDNGTSTVVSGNELADGLTLTLPEARSSKLLRYRPLK